MRLLAVPRTAVPPRDRRVGESVDQLGHAVGPAEVAVDAVRTGLRVVPDGEHRGRRTILRRIRGHDSAFQASLIEVHEDDVCGRGIVAEPVVGLGVGARDPDLVAGSAKGVRGHQLEDGIAQGDQDAHASFLAGRGCQQPSRMLSLNGSAAPPYGLANMGGSATNARFRTMFCRDRPSDDALSLHSDDVSFVSGATSAAS
jgi:hypothetical protein